MRIRAILCLIALLAACSSRKSPAGTDAGSTDVGWRVEEIAVGWAHSCARLADGTVWCWGSNKYGQLGAGGQALIMPARPTPIQVRDLVGVAELALGANHSCARMQDGTVRCWGSNDNGQLGDGTNTDRDTPTPVLGVAGARRIALGRVESCAVLANGTVSCWGALPQTIMPTPVQGLSDVVSVALGALHACALRKDGTVACWGENIKGQIGDATTEPRPQPTPVKGVAGAIQITSWTSSSCALLQGGSVVCWGSAGGPDGAPQPVAGLDGVAEIAGSCARGADGSVRCRRVDQLELIQGGGAAQIAFGVAHGCLRTLEGEVRCWGANRAGELGDGTQSDHRRPVPVAWQVK